MSGFTRISATLAAILLAASTSVAQEDGGQQRREGREGRRPPRDRMRLMQQLRRELIEQFDADGNGELDEGECEAARETARRRITEHAAQNANGELSAEQIEQITRMVLLGRRRPPMGGGMHQGFGGPGNHGEQTQGPPPWAGAGGEGNTDRPMQQMRERLDMDGDGQISEEERQALRERARQKVLEHFDTDGDGALAGEELDGLARILRMVRLRDQFRQNRGGPDGEDGERGVPPRRGRGMRRGEGGGDNPGRARHGRRPSPEGRGEGERPSDEPVPY